MYSDAPIEVSGLKVKERGFNFNEAFSAAPDWLRDFSFEVKNSSGKAIVCIFMAARFPETGQSPMEYQRLIGRPAGTDIESDGTALKLKPGEALRISLADNYERLKREYDTLRRLKGYREAIEDVSAVELRVTRVYFEDGTMWDLGGLYRPDPERPGKWLLLKERAFIPPA